MVGARVCTRLSLSEEIRPEKNACLADRVYETRKMDWLVASELVRAVSCFLQHINGDGCSRRLIGLKSFLFQYCFLVQWCDESRPIPPDSRP